jgi:hypothetical protein
LDDNVSVIGLRVIDQIDADRVLDASAVDVDHGDSLAETLEPRRADNSRAYRIPITEHARVVLERPILKYAIVGDAGEERLVSSAVPGTQRRFTLALQPAKFKREAHCIAFVVDDRLAFSRRTSALSRARDLTQMFDDAMHLGPEAYEDIDCFVPLRTA